MEKISLIKNNIIGHNSGAVDLSLLDDIMRDRNAGLLEGVEKLSADAASVPINIGNDDDGAIAIDFIKRCTSCKKLLEAAHKSEKEPFLVQGRAVDGFFKEIITKIESLAKDATRNLDLYIKAKHEAEQKRISEEAARLRAEADLNVKDAFDAGLFAENFSKTLKSADSLNEKAKKLDEDSSRVSGLASARSLSGASASMKANWVGEIVSLSDLDLNALRKFISEDSLQKAINLYVKSGGRQLQGAKIYQKVTTIVR